ncbi:glycosyltransferase family 2 protein [Myxococcota bacterium]|nr:glycosyltransferase family 2 protein [Myxococcota bacterium]
MPIDLSVVMFAYNEEENVGPVMLETLDFLRRATDAYELILVDDGSTDGTRQAALKVADDDPERVFVLSHARNRGIGGALKTGFAAANRDLVTLLPADGQIDPEELAKFFEPIGRADLVVCHYPNRFKTADNTLRLVLSRGLRALTWALTGVSTKLDGAYMIRREVLLSLPLRSDSFFLNLEVPIRAIRRGLRYEEVTLEVRPRRAGQSKVLNASRIRLVATELVRLGIELRADGGRG